MPAMTWHAPALLAALTLAGCATARPPSLSAPVPGPLELRSAQSRAFESADSRDVLKAVLGVLQDEGFAIRQVSADLGVVTAIKEWQSRQASKALKIAKWLLVPTTYGASLLLPSGRTELTAVEASVNVTQEGSRARVRFSLVARVTDKDGRVRSVRPVDDAEPYQVLLARVDKAIFLQREGL
jgi:hypothetical protein